MPVKEDRFPRLIDAVEKVADRSRMQDGAEETVESQLWVAENALVDRSPHVTSETFVTTGHERNPIRDSWLSPPPSRERDGAIGAVTSDAEHLDWQREGTEDHPIPTSPTGLWFWVGEPLKWPTRQPRPGFIYRQEVQHPGFGPWGGRDFVEVAAEDAEDTLVNLFVDLGDELAFEPLRSF
jgi:hypothetical protein